MTEYLIKRYILEQLYEQKEKLKCSEIYLSNILYQMYLEGEIRLNRNSFANWLKKLRESKILFGTYIKEMGYLLSNSPFEVSESNNITCLTNSNIILSQFGVDCYGAPYLNPIDELIINGTYDNQLIYIANVIKNNGFFTIGYCGNDNNYTKQIFEYYKKILEFLSTIVNKNRIITKEDIVDGKKIFVLTNKR